MSAESAPVAIIHNPDEQRFEAHIDGELAVLQYVRRPGTIVFTHTGVPEQLRGHGVANDLAQAGLEYARAEHLTVVPNCPFVAAYIRRHPGYQSLVDQGD